MSLSEDQRRELVAELRPLLPELYAEEPDARELLRNIGRPRARQSEFRNPAAFWDTELHALELGAIRDGIPALIVAVSGDWPGNDALSALVARVSTLDEEGAGPPPGDEDEPADITVKPDLPPAQVVAEPAPRFHTLTLVGSERHDEFLQLVRRLVYGDAEICYRTTAQSGQLPQSAVLIDDPGQRVAQIEEQLLAVVRDWDEGVTVEYQTSDTQPYLLRQVVVSGTDNQRFALRNVPSTTSLSEIARAVLQNYTDDATRARRGRIRTAIDRIGPDGLAERLDSSRTLSDAGVQDGDELRLATEAVAGVGTALWRSSVLRARTQIHQYARDHPGFVIVQTDNVNLPTRYLVEFRALGFAPPADPGAWPVSPRLRSEHRVVIVLLTSFPVAPPIAVFESEIFHPNVLAAPVGIAPRGFACLGALTDSYRPDMDFGQLCQMLVDMAGYRQYETREVQQDGEGYLNRLAATWASSDAGQQRIADRGGLREAEMSGPVGQDDGKRQRLDIEPLDEDWEDYEDEG
jgi:Effector-associated domain 1/YukD-like N-terminal domain